MTTAAPPRPRLCCSADLRAFDLAHIGIPAQLLAQFEALRQTGSAYGVAFRHQAAGGIDHITAPVGVISVCYKATCFAFTAEPQAS